MLLRHERPERTLVTHENLRILSIMAASIAYVAENSSFPIFLSIHSDTFDVRLISFFNYSLILGVATGSIASFRATSEIIFKVGVCIFLFGAVLFCSHQNTDVLILSRIIQGFGAGMYSPLIPVLLFRTEKRYKIKILSIWAFITGVSGIATPSIIAFMHIRFGINVFWTIISFFCAISLLFSHKNFTLVYKNANSLKLQQLSNDFRWTKIVPVMAFIFLLYGSITWSMYFIPYSLELLSENIQVFSLIGSLPWFVFTIGCIAIGRANSASMNTFLLLSLMTALIALLLLVGFGPESPHRLALSASAAGLAMALANVPSTAIAFSITRREHHGIVSAMDIISARAGSAVFLTAFSFETNILYIAATVLVAGLICLALIPTVANTGSAECEVRAEN
jgi:MFS family permease